LPYRSPPPAWISGREALEHIKGAEKCSESDAIAQLRKAVLGRAIPIRFRGRTTPRLGKDHPLGLFLPQGGPGGSPILSVNWRDLLLPTAQFRANGMVKFRKARWQPFEVRRDAVLRIFWPGGWVSRSAAQQKRCLTWLVDDLKARGTDISKVERRKYAVEKFRVSIRGFDRIWAQAIIDAGVQEKASRPGAKKKSSRIIVTPNKS